MEFPKPLSDTLLQFNAASLADGNLAAGTNVLAAMCSTLANTLPRGAGFVTASGDLLPIGTDFLMLDGLSRTLIDAKVFDQMGIQQANLTANVEEGNAYTAHHGTGRNIQGDTIHAPPSPDTPLVRLEADLTGFGMMSGHGSPIEALLSPPPHGRLRELRNNPLVFTRLDAGSPSIEILGSAHLRQPFIRAFLDTDSGRKRFVSSLRSFTQSGAGNTPLQPRLALSAAPAVFRELFMNGEADFLSKQLWILDHHQASPPYKPSPPGSFPVGQAFDRALRRSWVERLNSPQSPPPTTKFEWQSSQMQWVSYLTQQEARFPGISSVGYTLFATLLFGLCRLRTKASGKVNPTGVLQMSKHLIERMVGLREHLVQSEEKARLVQIALKLVPKMEREARTARELVRKCNRLPISTCREALQLLVKERIVVEAAPDRWQLVLPVTDGLRKIKTSIIDV